MPTMSDALGYSLTRRANLDRWTFRDHVEYLVGLAGSGRALGRALGVAESTVRGWRHGATPRTGMRPFVVEMARTAMVDAHRGWPNNRAMTITGEIRVSGDIRSRTIHVGRFIPTGVIDGVLDAWVVGDDLGAAQRLERATGRYYATGLQIGDVTGISW